jgi:hypothetical protein
VESVIWLEQQQQRDTLLEHVHGQEHVCCERCEILPTEYGEDVPPPSPRYDEEGGVEGGFTFDPLTREHWVQKIESSFSQNKQLLYDSIFHPEELRAKLMHESESEGEGSKSESEVDEGGGEAEGEAAKSESEVDEGGGESEGEASKSESEVEEPQFSYDSGVEERPEGRPKVHAGFESH